MTTSFFSNHSRTIWVLGAVSALLLMSSMGFAGDSGISDMIGVGTAEVKGSTGAITTLLKILIGVIALIGFAGVIWGVVDSGNMKKITVGGVIIVVAFVSWAVLTKLNEKVQAQTYIAPQQQNTALRQV